ncbi:MAG: T9SS type A sorting domain-containing protein [Flavobacteriaceae bacterium]|nr:T9SS type A sorting domain-containing protein [Flavobacteriaceae bacterium]
MKRAFTSILFYLFISPLISQEILWEKTIGGDKSELLHDLIPTPDFGFLIAGSSLSDKSGNKAQNSQGDLDYFIWKMDENGKQEWQRSYGGSGTDHLLSLKLTRDGGYILGGTSNSPKDGDKKSDSFGNDDYWIIKLNPKGEEEWQVTLGGMGQDILLSIEPTLDDGFIVGGSSDSGKSLDENMYSKSQESKGSLDFWIVKLDKNGQIEWQKTIGGRYTDLLRSILPTEDGGYILGGYSNSPVSGDKSSNLIGDGNYWILKLDNKGEILWDKSFGGDGADELTTILPSKNGFIVGGNSNSKISGNKQVSNVNGTDFWILFLDKEGEIIQQYIYDIGENDVLTSINTASNGHFLLSGYAKSKKENASFSQEDYVVIKIDEEGNEIWRKILGGDGTDRLQNTIQTRDGGYILAGVSNSSADGEKNAKNLGRDDFWIVKLMDKDSELKTEVQKLEIYPNPADDFVNILVHENFKQANLKIFDMMGALMYQQTLKQKITPVDIRQLQTGAYIIQVQLENKMYNQKLLKK